MKHIINMFSGIKFGELLCTYQHVCSLILLNHMDTYLELLLSLGDKCEAGLVKHMLIEIYGSGVPQVPNNLWLMWPGD